MAKQVNNSDRSASPKNASPKKAAPTKASTTDDDTGGVNLSSFRLTVAWVLSLAVFGGIWAGALYAGKQFHTHIHTQEIHLEKFLIEHPGMLILSQGRSGGSFLGSWFQTSSKFLYVNEPCAVPYTGATTAKTGKVCTEIVNQILKCDFSSVYPGETRRQAKLHNDFEGWGNRTSIDECEKQLKVVKETRIGPYGFNTEGSAVEGRARIVVLLRDPRAIWASRLRAWPVTAEEEEEEELSQNPKFKWMHDPAGYDPATSRGYPFTQSIKSLCDEQREFIAARKRHGQQLVHIVRYIDLVRKPHTVAKGVYKFNFLPPIPEVDEYIEKHTTGDCEHEGKWFSTCRNTKGLGEDWKDINWRNELSDEVVEDINAKCEDVIEYHEHWETAEDEE